MNLREVQLSSRCVIPVALALPINREPAHIQSHTEWMQRRRDAAAELDELDELDGDRKTTVSFYL